MREDLLDALFIVEAGTFVFYEYVEGERLRRWSAPRVAIAYNTDTLEYYRLGPPEPLMFWAAEQARRLRSEGRFREATSIGVALLPRDIAPRELNTLQHDSGYLTIFLQKVGLI